MKKWVLFISVFTWCTLLFSQEYSIIHNGLTRTYRLYLPDGYNPSESYPLVINMHGMGSNALEQEIYTEFNQVSDTGEFIVVYPNGVNKLWNVSSTSGVDDVGFISALIDTLDVLYSIDLQRVYATGMSMGGFMSYRLACELSDRIAAIASVTGLQAFFPCTPSRPVPVLQMHGTADGVVPYAGVAPTIANWVGYNACSTDPLVYDLPDIDTTDNSTVTVSQYFPCDDSSEVLLYTINGGGHTWPGSNIIIGITNQDIKASNEIWGFFRKYTLEGTSSLAERYAEDAIKLSIYPNPAGDYAAIEAGGIYTGQAVMNVYDITGRMLRHEQILIPGRYLFERKDLPGGLYVIKVETHANISAKVLILK
ncbi:MAG: PHB depolymerase family esterase [Bacteroidales bacterium]